MDLINDLQGKNINLLIGSGASVGLIPTLQIDSLNCTFEDLITDPEFQEYDYLLYYLWFEHWVKNTEINSFDSNNNIHLNYKKLVEKIINILNNEGFDKQKRANIFTTNYDTLFEITFDEISKEQPLIYFNDGGRGFFTKTISTENFHLNITHSAVNDTFQRQIPTINLLKMHGSITWQKNNDHIKSVFTQNELFNSLKEQSKNIKESIPEIDELFDILENKQNDNQDINDCMNTFKKKLDTIKLSNKYVLFENFSKLYKELLIVNPTKRKFKETVLEQHYYQLLRMLSFELERKDSCLIVFGFSFSDEHILEIIKRSIINPYLKVYIIAYTKKEKNRIQNKIGSLPNKAIEFIPSNNEFDNGIKGDFTYLLNKLDGK